MEKESPDSWWNLVSLAMKVAIFTYLGCAVYFWAFPYGINLQRLWNPYTKLRPFERPITDVASEFLRRSPRLRDLVQRYGECQPRCPDSFYAESEAVVREEWPGMLARLRVSNDWSASMREKSWSYDQVGIILDDYKDEAVIRCVPKLRYSYTTMTGPYLHFERFVCIPPEATLPPG